MFPLQCFTVLIKLSIRHLLKTLDLPSGEDVSTVDQYHFEPFMGASDGKVGDQQGRETSAKK